MWALCDMGFYFATCNEKRTDHIDDAVDVRYIILIICIRLCFSLCNVHHKHFETSTQRTESKYAATKTKITKSKCN